MDEQWRTEEPEVGQPLRIYGESEFALRIYRGRQNGYFMFEGQDGMAAEEDVPEWIPITTPEEQRLRARVRELEEVFQVTKEFCKLRGMWVQTFRADATSLLKRMAELTESGGVGDATNDN